MTTIHANTSADALSRLESMVAMASRQYAGEIRPPADCVRDFVIVQVMRMSDGTRKVVNISEITGLEENIVSMHDIFNFVRKASARMEESWVRFSPPGFVPSFSTGCVWPASCCRPSCLSAPWRSNEHAARNQRKGRHMFADGPRDLCREFRVAMLVATLIGKGASKQVNYQARRIGITSLRRRDGEERVPIFGKLTGV